MRVLLSVYYVSYKGTLVISDSEKILGAWGDSKQRECPVTHLHLVCSLSCFFVEKKYTSACFSVHAGVSAFSAAHPIRKY